MQGKASSPKVAQDKNLEINSKEIVSEQINYVYNQLNKQGKEHVFDLIKSFKGNIYTKQSKEYFENIKQYASASIPKSSKQPYLLTYPQDTQDIAIMIKAAQLLNKKIVARSGGHQYCGLSLGGIDTIVLSMNNFNTLKLNQEGIIEAEACVSLIQFSKQQKQWGMFVPHGRCPLIHIGGHAQTGGYGPFLRSFGIFIDFIIGFEIVLANGELKRVNRLLPNAVISNEEERFNLQVFRGVLGGNAGSFGIITKYYIKAVKDVDHPQSYGFSHVRIYHKDLMRQILKVIKKWTEIIAEGQNDQSLKGCNIQIATSDIELSPYKTKAHAIFLTGNYGDPDKGVPYNNQFKQILEIFKKAQTLQQKQLNIFLESWQGHYPLSELAARNLVAGETQTGTVISLPYNQRCNLTMSPLNDNFINEYLQFTSQLINNMEKSTRIETFMMIAGGAHKENGKPTVDGLTITSISQRDFVHTFMLDILFDLALDPLAGEKAIQIQSQMERIVVEHYNTPSLGEKRLLVRSFGDIDMTKQSVIMAYYDSMEQYAQLQKLKQKVDPNDVFHTIMTVKLPKK